MPMHAVIFAAGRGTRMGALCKDLPKPLIEVAGIPIILRTLSALPDAVERVIIVVGHLQSAIRDAEGIKGRDDITIVEQPELTGTYDALLMARPHLPPGPFLVVNGDDIYAKEGLTDLANASPFAIMTKRVARPNRYSHLETKDGRLSSIVPNGALPPETIRSETCTYTGAALLDASFFGLSPADIPRANAVPGAGSERSLPHTLEKHHREHPVAVIEGPLWLPVGTPEELHEAEAALSPKG